MKHRISKTLSGLIVRHPGLVAIVLVIATILGGWQASKLHINNNQIELIPQDLPAVIATKKMIEMIDTVGFLLLPLKGPDLDHIKTVATELGPRIEAIDDVRYVRFRQDTDFIRDRIGMYIETADLKEGAKRLRKKIREILNRNNPFHIQLRETKPEPLELDDLVQKYRRVAKKEVDDPFYTDISGEMILMVIKPRGQSTDLGFTKQLLVKVQKVIDDYNADNTHSARLTEHYEGYAPDATVTYGYTGAFKTNLDDSETIAQALVPTSTFAFVAILIYLLITLRRPTQVAIIMVTLGIALVMTFGLAQTVIGELNTITSMLVAILMGLGIDYGIHLTYRFREEYTRRRALPEAIEETILNSGAASLASAVTTSAALFLLMMSDFRGFSDFGFIAGVGVPLTFAVMYITIPTIYVLIDRVAPAFKESLVTESRTEAHINELSQERFPYAKRILVGTVILTAILAAFAWQIEFDYDGRALMSANRPSLVLQEEVRKRYAVSSDPVGFYTETVAETKALYDTLHPPPEDTTIDVVLSLFTLIPPADQQQANRKILDKLKRQIEPITADMIEDETIRKNFDRAKKLLDAQPFAFEDVPPHILEQFRPIRLDEYPGYLTFVYPINELWDGEMLVDFSDEVGQVRVGDKTYNAAGLAVLYAQLARIVLKDGVLFTLLAAIAIFIIAAIDFRSLMAAVFAMLPLLAGFTWMLGLMAIFNWNLNFANIVVMPLVFGYGISAGMHLYHRFRESGSVMVAMRCTGGAVAASSVTTLVGWGALLLSNHRALSSLGILACFGVASTLLVSLTVLPALLQVTQKRPQADGAREQEA